MALCETCTVGIDRHRVLFDTNVWSRLSDYGYGLRVAEEARARGAQVGVAPLTLLEASADTDSRAGTVSSG